MHAQVLLSYKLTKVTIYAVNFFSKGLLGVNDKNSGVNLNMVFSSKR